MAREHVLITGPSGSGKSTISDILGGADLDECGSRDDDNRWVVDIGCAEGKRSGLRFVAGVATNSEAIIAMGWEGIYFLFPTPSRLRRNLVDRLCLLYTSPSPRD